MKRLCSNLIKRESGQTMLETAMLLPWLFIILFGITELTLYLYSRNVVQYATYMAARSAVAYGQRNLGDINYPFTGSGNETNKEQRIAEAIAQKIIFESLPWEHKRIRELKSLNYEERVYFDPKGNTGGVRIQRIDLTGKEATVELLYCMPLHFNLHNYFVPESMMQPCKNFSRSIGGDRSTGLPIVEKVTLQIVN